MPGAGRKESEDRGRPESHRPGWIGVAAFGLSALAVPFLRAAPLSRAHTDSNVSLSPVVNVRSFGAAGDGRTDDTPAIQAAIDEALKRRDVVYMPPGYYRTTRTLELGLPKGRHYTSLVGASVYGTTILYDGGPNAPILRIRGGYGIGVRDLALLPANASHEPTAGIAFPADADHPSSGLCTFERIRVDNCRVGFDFNRGSDRQVSEITLEACTVSGAAQAAYRIEGWNALNYLYLNCVATNCGAGWWIERTNSVSIVGGSCSAVGTVLKANAGGNISMRGMRAETSKRLADLGTVMANGEMGVSGAPIQATIEDTSFKPLAGQLAADGHAIRIADAGPTRIVNCFFRLGDIAFLAYKHGYSVLSVEDCVFDKSAGRGVLVQGAGDERLDLRDCRITDGSADGKPVGLLNRPEGVDH